MNGRIRIAWVLIAALLIPACGGGSGGSGGPSPVPKGARILGVQIDDAEDADFDAATQKVLDLGAEASAILFAWSSIETAPQTYDPGLLPIVDTYFPAWGLSMHFVIAPINTNVDERPADLVGLAWDDPLVISRFNQMQDYLFSQIPNVTLISYAIGNEVAASLSSAAEYAAYKNFYDAALAHAKTLRPGLKIGVTVQLDGLIGPWKTQIQSLNANSDYISVTYYPLNPDFTMRPPTDVHADFASLLAEYPAISIHVQEIGYSSSATCNSSEAAQAQFVLEVFRMWDTHAAQIPVLLWFKSTDWSQAEVDQFVLYYGLASPEFQEYLRTLGIRRWPGSGTDKPAYTTFQSAAAARGW